jgi:hypothetical protein
MIVTGGGNFVGGPRAGHDFTEESAGYPGENTAAPVRAGPVLHSTIALIVAADASAGG